MGRNSANRRPKSQPSAPRKSKDSLARGLGSGSLVISVLSLTASSCQNWIAWSQLQDQREASIKIEARNPFGTIHRPEVIMKISNLSEKPIRRAEVGASLRMLAPDHVGEIFENMETRNQEIEASDFEPQHILVPEPLDDVQSGALASGPTYSCWRASGEVERSWRMVVNNRNALLCLDRRAYAASRV